ncbi:hypothetical protein FNV43_RR16429 [Rhamnella rubrinervis]|uniref:Glutaredoxin domain-containing protein n=1 Tax=Rhamnella rubrinervis TaxID=2594499 RepID=A0A8K0GYT0_9ROSA|nr:hypothetical protein FNV43_RR16429 [Rhamnella rubrinervis]
MGCSASKPVTILAKNPEQRSSSSPCACASASHSSNSSPPVPRVLSLPTPLVHHLPLRKGDTHHLVSLTSTTYGSLLLIDRTTTPKVSNLNVQDPPHLAKSPPSCNTTQECVIPTNPEHSLSPDSVINTWELMDGLDDLDLDCDGSSKTTNSSIFDCSTRFPNKPSSCRYTSFDAPTKKRFCSFGSEKSSEKIVEDSSPLSSSSSSTIKPLWQHLSEESLLSKMDPNVVFTYRRALSSRQLGFDHSKTISSPPPGSSSFQLSGTEDRIVIYFTSLRGIRKTYEDCCSVRMILRGFRVPVDERDISMDSDLKKELQNALPGKAVTLPQVFIRGKHVGGAEEVKELHEVGELATLLDGFPVQEPGFVCQGCGDARFVLCLNCNGSRKVFEEEEGGLRRCLDCNENGLVRCPGCCS